MSSFQHINLHQEQTLHSNISEFHLTSQDELQVIEELDDNQTGCQSPAVNQDSLSYNSQSDILVGSASPGFLGVDFDGEDDDWFNKEVSSKSSNPQHSKNSETRLDQIPLDLQALPSAPLLRPQTIHQAINFSPLWLSDSPFSSVLSSRTPVPSYKKGQLPTISYPLEPSILTRSSYARPSAMSVTSTDSTITPHAEAACAASISEYEQTCPASGSENQEIILPSEDISRGEVHNEESYAGSSVLLSLTVPHSSDERSNRSGTRSSFHTVQPESISRLILHGPSLASNSSSSSNILTLNNTKESRTQQLGRRLPPVKIVSTHSRQLHDSQSLPLGAIPSSPDTSLSVEGQSIFSPSPTESSTTISWHSLNSESDSSGLISSSYPSSMESHDSRPIKKDSRSVFPFSETFPSTLSPSSIKISSPSMVPKMGNYSQADEEMDEVLDLDNFQIPACYNDFVFSETDNIGPAVIKRSMSQSDRQPSTHSKTSLQHVKSLDLTSRKKTPSLFSLSKLKPRESAPKLPMSSRDSSDHQAKKSILCRDSVDSMVNKPAPSRSRSLQLMNNVDVPLQNATQNIYPRYGMETEDEEEELSRWFGIADDVISQSHRSILERNRAFVRDLKLPALGSGRTASNPLVPVRQSSESEGYVYGPTTSNVLEGFSKESPKVRLQPRMSLRQMNRSKFPSHSQSLLRNDNKSSKAHNVITSLYQTFRMKKQPTQVKNPTGLSPNSIPSCSNSSHYSISSSSTSTSSPSPVSHSPHSILLDHGDRSQPPGRSISQSGMEPPNINSIRSGVVHQSGNSFVLESSKSLQHTILNNQYHHPIPNPTNSNSHLIHPCRPNNSPRGSKYSQSSLGLDLNR